MRAAAVARGEASVDEQGRGEDQRLPSARITVPDHGSSTSATVVGEDQTAPITGGVIADDFPAHAYRGYQFYP